MHRKSLQDLKTRFLLSVGMTVATGGRFSFFYKRDRRHSERSEESHPNTRDPRHSDCKEESPLIMNYAQIRGVALFSL